MALLNPSPVLVMPTTMWLAYQEIARHPGQSEDAVVDALCPPVIRSVAPSGNSEGRDGLSPKPASVAVARLKSLGVADPNVAGCRLVGSPVNEFGDFMRLMRGLIMDPANCAVPADGDLDSAPGTADIVAALAWFLTVDPYTGWDWARVDATAPSGTLINNSRWPGFQFWSVALGLAEIAVLKGSGIMPNPTRALAQVLRKPIVGPPFEPGRELPIRALVEYVRREIPVVPGGRLSSRDGVRDQLDLMAATSYALLCAEQYSWLRMTALSDAAEILSLDDPDAATGTRAVSHFTYLGVPDA